MNYSATDLAFEMLKQLDVIIERGEKRGLVTKILFLCDLDTLMDNYGDFFRERKEDIKYAMNKGFLELYVLKENPEEVTQQYAVVDEKIY